MEDTLQAHLDRVYGATSSEQLTEAYNRWAATYDRDMEEDLGWGGPEEAARALARHAPADGPVLDVGCGTGLVGRALRAAGFARVVAADLSEGMLEVARGRGVYEALHRVEAASPLPFADSTFAAVVAVGVLTQGHAAPACLRDWVRVTRSGGHVAFTLRPDLADSLGYRGVADALQAEGAWDPVEETADLTGFRRLQSRPYRVWVYRVH